MKMETQQPKMYGVSKRYAKREVHSSTRLSQKTRETSNKKLNLTPQTTRKIGQKVSQS